MRRMKAREMKSERRLPHYIHDTFLGEPESEYRVWSGDVPSK